MRLSQELLGSKAKIQLLEKIVDSPHAYTVRDLARMANLPKSTVADIVNDWQKAGLIETRFVGRAKTVKIKPDYPLVSAVLELFRQERVFLERIAKTIQKDSLLKAKEVIAVVLYGSFARQNIGAASDIDVLVVTEHELNEKHPANKAWERLYTKLPLTPSIAFMTQQEIQQRIKANDSYIRNIFREGKPIKGSDWFDATKRTIRSR
ncbi:MAG: nucleotidyltransferase domain-containing protein [Candidatus Micrarchaeota archaeon]